MHSRINLTVHLVENLLDCTRTKGTLTIDVFTSGLHIEFDTAHTRGLLTTVVLLLHQQIELVEPVSVCTIFFVVVAKRLQKPYHCHTTFMLNLFHSDF